MRRGIKVNNPAPMMCDNQPNKQYAKNLTVGTTKKSIDIKFL
jgi:hypothetical protein